MVDHIIAIISIILSSVGITVAFAVFIYVRCFAIKEMDEKLEHIQESQPPIANDQRVGIEPKKEVVIEQQLPTQESTRSTVTDSTYFVSYFGMCFQKEPLKHLGMESSRKVTDNKGVMKKRMMDIDEEKGEGKPCQSIEFPKQEVMNEKMMVINEERGEGNPCQSIEFPHQEEKNESIFQNNSSINIPRNDGEHSSIESSLSDRQQSQDFFHNNPNVVIAETKMRQNDEHEQSQDIFRSNPFKFEEKDANHDSGDLDLSDDTNTTSVYDDGKDSNEDDGTSFKSDDKFEYSDDDEESFHTPPEDNTMNSVQKLKSPIDNAQIDALYLAPRMEKNDTEKNDHNLKIPANNEMMRIIDDIPAQQYKNNIDTITESKSDSPNDNTIHQTRTFHSENQSYLSSDDDKSSIEDFSDTFYTSTETSEDFHSPKYMINKIDSSLSLPDLAGSSESGSGDSGDWELSSSSEDRSEKEESTKRIVLKKRKSAKPKIETIDEYINKTYSNNDHVDQSTSSIPTDQRTINICPFCNKEYNKEECIQFSYDERCQHLMCMNCCEEGIAAKYNGACPICNFDDNNTSTVSRKRMSMPPRAGERKYTQEQVIMAI